MLRVLGLVAATAVVLAACGGAAAPATVSTAPTVAAASATAAPSASTAAAAGNAVTVQGFKFLPPTLEVPVGTTVTWTNKDTAPHTVTAGTPSAKLTTFDGALEPSGGTFTFKFTTAGTFAYFCAKHPTSMLGTIVVK